MFIEKISNFSQKNTKVILWTSIVVYTVFFSILSLKKYYLFAYNAYDLAIFNQVFYNTMHGDWLIATVNANVYLADHFTPIIILLLPFYYFKQSAESLLVLQTVFLALAAWPLYKIALQVNRDKLIALLVALMWLFNPYVHGANLFEFHLLSVAIFFLFWSFYFYIKNKFLPFLIFFILTILVREDMSLLLLSFSILSYLDKKTLKWKLTSFFLPIVYFLVAMKVIAHFSSLGDYKFIIYYSWLGGHDFLSIILSWLSHPFDFALHIFSLGNIGGIFIILLPFLFIPLINKKYLLLLLFPLIQFILTSSGINFVIYLTHYILFLLPALFISLIYSFKDFKNGKKFWNSKIIYANKSVVYILLFISIVYFSLTLSPAVSVVSYDYDKQRQIEAKQFASYIEDTDIIATQSSFIANLSSRTYIYPIHYTYFGSSQFAYDDFVLPRVDKILMDFDDFMAILVERETGELLQDDKIDMPSNFRSILSEYNLSQASNNFLLWENKEDSFRNLKLFEVIDKPVGFDNDNFLLKYENIYNLEQESLKLSFQKNSLESRNYVVRFYRGDYHYNIPLDYGMLPESEWNDDKIYEFYYFPDKNVESFEIFSWQGINKLGRIREVVPDLELVSVVGKIDL